MYSLFCLVLDIQLSSTFSNYLPFLGFVVDDTMFFEIIADNSYEALHGLNVSVQETRGSSNVSQIK